MMRWLGCGSTSFTIRSTMWRGVRNWPLVPDCESLLSRLLIHVALEVAAILPGEVEGVDPGDDGLERRAVVDLQVGVAEELATGGGEAGELVQALYHGAEGVEELVAGERDDVVPGVPRPLALEDGGVAALDDAELLITLGEQAEEEEVGELLDGVHGVVDAARPEGIHPPVDLLAHARREEVGAGCLGEDGGLRGVFGDRHVWFPIPRSMSYVGTGPVPVRSCRRRRLLPPRYRTAFISMRPRARPSASRGDSR